MAKRIKTIDYDSEQDIFSVSNGDKVKASLDIGEFILDVNHDDFICGVEILDASENMGISKEILKSIQNIQMSVTYKTEHIYVLLMIMFKKEGKTVNIPIPLTLNLGHKSPMKEVFVYN